jgi:TolB-like protein/Tfp pilus assembly protein PilF
MTTPAAPQVPDHEVLRFIASGAYGDVWLARTVTGAYRAVKVVRREAFEREFAGARNFEPVSRAHDGLVDVLHVGRNDAGGYFYYVMELADDVTGQFDPAKYAPKTLRAVLKQRGKLPASECIELGLNLAGALQCLHEHGLIHRDIKPSNIIYVAGQPKLADVGLVTAPSDETASYVGTEGYIPPEGPGKPQADVFSLGKVLYEAATGKDRDQFPELPTLSEVATPLNDVILKACEADLRRRYASAKEMREDLAALSAGKAIRRRRSRWWWAIPASALVVVAAALWSRHRPATPDASIAVLPFANMSHNADDEYLCDGFTEEITDALSKVKGLRVASRTSSSFFKGRSDADVLSKIGRQLHVGTALEGGVTRAGNTLRISTRLINLADGFCLWRETYDRPMTNILTIRSDVAQRVAEALKGRLSGDERSRIARQPTTNIEAHRLYLLGRYYWNKRHGPDIQHAIQLLQQAIDLDPGYALAYAGLADCYLLLPVYVSSVRIQDAYPKAKQLALKALELDDTLGEPHATLGELKVSFDFDYPGAEQEFLRAEALNPNYATAFQWHGNLLLHLGRLDEGLKLLRRAQELDPLSPIIASSIGYAMYMTRQYDAALTQVQSVLEFDPNFEVALDTAALIHIERGEYDAAIKTYEKLRVLQDGEAFALASLGYAHARAGQRDKAQHYLDELDTLAAKEDVEPRAQALVYVGLGDRDRAIEYLNKACDKHTFTIDFVGEPIWDDLRTDPRYRKLLARINVPNP